MPTPTPELNKALAAFQSDLPKIPKDAKGEIRGVTKDGKPYSYQFDYASLEGVTDEALPALGRQGLSLTGAVTTDDQGRIVYEYTLLHSSGEERGPWQFPLWLLLPDRFTAQTIGGYVSYARRYIIGPVTGVAPGGQDIDTHGAEESGASGGRWMNRRPDVPPAHLRDKITPGPRPGPELEQLRDGTVEASPDDRAARRVRPGQDPPAEDDMWAGQPAGPPLKLPPPSNEPGSADGKQIRDISVQLNTLGITDHEEQLARIERIILGPLDGPHIADDGTRRTRKNLSRAEAEDVKRKLAEAIKAMKLAERAKAEQDAAAEVTS
jgi:hypothetical protein